MKIWIARDFDDYIFLHTKEPKLLDGEWSSERVLMLNKTDFPEVTFENSPQEIELVIKK